MELEIEDIDCAALQAVRNQTKRLYHGGSIRVSPPGCVLNAGFRDHVARVKQLRVRPDDVWVISFPKAGTTWTQEMVWLIVNEQDYETAKKKTLHERFPYLELSCCTAPSDGPDTVAYTDALASPRCIKSHLHKQLLPDALWREKPKIIYVSREAKDVAVSYYYHNCLMNGYTGTRDEFYEAFLQDVLMYSPFCDHVLEFRKMRAEPNVFFNTYEEMKKDLPGVIVKMSKFLEKSLTDAQVATLADHLNFDNMRDNPSINFEERRDTWTRNKLTTLPGLRFIRRGEVGVWRESMSADVAARFDRWTRQKLGNSELPSAGNGSED